MSFLDDLKAQLSAAADQAYNQGVSDGKSLGVTDDVKAQLKAEAIAAFVPAAKDAIAAKIQADEQVMVADVHAVIDSLVSPPASDQTQPQT